MMNGESDPQSNAPTEIDRPISVRHDAGAKRARQAMAEPQDPCPDLRVRVARSATTATNSAGLTGLAMCLW